MKLHIARALLASLVLIPGWLAAQQPPKPAAKQVQPAQGPQSPQQAASPQQAQPTAAWFDAQLVPVNQGKTLYAYCSGVADALAKQAPPPGFYDRSAVEDRAHNKAVFTGSPFHKGVAAKSVPTAHQQHANFVAQGEAALKKCGTDLSFYTTRMPAHLQSIHDALEKSEGKISPQEGEKIGDALEAYDTAQERFVKALAALSNDPRLQGELHAAIVHVVQQTTPPAHAKH